MGKTTQTSVINGVSIPTMIDSEVVYLMKKEKLEKDITISELIRQCIYEHYNLPFKSKSKR